jgi:hypothetical protein
MQFSIIDKKTGKVYETDGNKIWDDLFYYQKQYSEMGMIYTATEARFAPAQNVVEEVVVETPVVADPVVETSVVEEETVVETPVVETPVVVEETVVADPVTE